MNELLHQFKQEAKKLAKEHVPSFYTACHAELQFARELFFDHPLLYRCREDVLPFLNDSYGHGIEHAKSVAIEGSAILLAEAGQEQLGRIRHLALLAQMSGLLHDICRLESDHARRSSEFTLTVLQDYPLDDAEKEMICFAIRNHEAVAIRETPPESSTALLTGALYDADKFRWGPDHFTTTLWEICDYEEWTMGEVLERFPQGVQRMRELLPTFRTRIGRTHGPEFIQIGLTMGELLHSRLKTLTDDHSI